MSECGAPWHRDQGLPPPKAELEHYGDSSNFGDILHSLQSKGIDLILSKYVKSVMNSTGFVKTGHVYPGCFTTLLQSHL